MPGKRVSVVIRTIFIKLIYGTDAGQVYPAVPELHHHVQRLPLPGNGNFQHTSLFRRYDNRFLCMQGCFRNHNALRYPVKCLLNTSGLYAGQLVQGCGQLFPQHRHQFYSPSI